jgi:hypothetical protein
MTGAFSLMVSQYPQSRASAQLATGLEVEYQDEYGSTRPPSTENYQIAPGSAKRVAIGNAPDYHHLPKQSLPAILAALV